MTARPLTLICGFGAEAVASDFPAPASGRPPHDDDLISLEEAAARLGVRSIKTVRRRIKEAGLQPPRPGRVMMLTEADYRELVAASRRRSKPAPASADAAAALKRARGRQSRRLAAKLRGGAQVIALSLERT